MNRIAAIDWMRGMVMMLMALDHASGFFNDGRIFADSVLLYEAGDIFATDQFMTRWVTHICAPTFVFLSGAAIAISISQRQAQGIGDASINRDLLIRGAFIALLDMVLLSLAADKLLLQVLYAIGVSMMLMVPLRYLGTRIVFISALVILLGGEAVTVWLWDLNAEVPLWLALTLVPVFGEAISVMYPLLPWLTIMMLGWVWGQRIVMAPQGKWTPLRLLIVGGISALVFFVLIRFVDGYGNMLMYLEGNSLVQWLHVSKYPPSLAYTMLELSLMAIILAGLMWLTPKIGVRDNGPVLIFGQTALFFYLAHFAVLLVLSQVFSRGGLEQAYWIATLVLIILYPICRFYRTIKQRYPQSLLRFL